DEGLLVKAAVLPTGPQEPFALLETFAVEGGHARHLQRHLERMLGSAAALGIPVGREEVEEAAREAVPAVGAAPVLLRLALRADGSLEISSRPLVASSEPVRLALDTVRTAFPAGLSRHKTTVRGHFTAARERHPGAEDVVLLGEHGRAVETTIATLAARIDGTWCTPPLHDGCLDGVGRRLALEAGQMVERELTVPMVREAEHLAVLSSARGWRPAVLAAP